MFPVPYTHRSCGTLGFCLVLAASLSPLASLEGQEVHGPLRVLEKIVRADALLSTSAGTAGPSSANASTGNVAGDPFAARAEAADDAPFGVPAGTARSNIARGNDAMSAGSPRSSQVMPRPSPHVPENDGG